MSEDDTHFSHEDQLKQGYVFDPDSYPFDASPVHTGLQPSSDKSSEHFAVQFGFRSIAPGRDDSDNGEGGRRDVKPAARPRSSTRLNTYIGDTEGKIAILLEARDGLT